MLHVHLQVQTTVPWRYENNFYICQDRATDMFHKYLRRTIIPVASAPAW